MAIALVTGGAGFIGSHVAAELLRHEHTVVVLDDLSGGHQSNVPLACAVRAGSILDERKSKPCSRSITLTMFFTWPPMRQRV